MTRLKLLTIAILVAMIALLTASHAIYELPSSYLMRGYNEYNIQGKVVGLRRINDSQGIILFTNRLERFEDDPLNPTWQTYLPPGKGKAKYLEVAPKKGIAMVGTDKGWFLWYSLKDGNLLGEGYFNHLETFKLYESGLGLRTRRWAYKIKPLPTTFNGTLHKPQEEWHYDFKQKISGVPILDSFGNLLVPSLYRKKLFVVKDGAFKGFFKFKPTPSYPTYLGNDLIGVCSSRGFYVLGYDPKVGRVTVKVKKELNSVYTAPKEIVYINDEKTTSGEAICVGEGGISHWHLELGKNKDIRLVRTQFLGDISPFSESYFYEPFDWIRDKYSSSYRYYMRQSTSLHKTSLGYDLRGNELATARLKIWRKRLAVYEHYKNKKGKRTTRIVEEYVREVGVLSFMSYDLDKKTARIRTFILFDIPRYSHFRGSWVPWDVLTGLTQPYPQYLYDPFWKEYIVWSEEEKGVFVWGSNDKYTLFFPAGSHTKLIELYIQN